jgi:two-component system, cell cycle response regulator DivK
VSRILVVDDQLENLELLQYLLTRSGHTVVTALGGQAGLEKAEEIKPDLMLIDLRMPGIDGWELARRIRSHPGLADTRLLAVSVGPATTARAREAGFDGFFPMPFEPIDLLRTVDVILSDHDGDGLAP